MPKRKKVTDSLTQPSAGWAERTSPAQLTLWEGSPPTNGHPLQLGCSTGERDAPLEGAKGHPPDDEENEEISNCSRTHKTTAEMAWYGEGRRGGEGCARSGAAGHELIALKEEDRKDERKKLSPRQAIPSNKQRSQGQGGKLTRQAREAQLINQMIAVRKRWRRMWRPKKSAASKTRSSRTRLQASARCKNLLRYRPRQWCVGHFGLHIEDWSDGASTQSQSSTATTAGPTAASLPTVIRPPS